MNPLPMRSIETLTQYDLFMDALRRRVATCQSLITSMTLHVKHQLNKIEEEHCLAQRLQQHFSITTHQPPLVILKVEAGGVTSPICTPSETDSMKIVDERMNVTQSIVIRGVRALALHCRREIST